MQQCPEAVVRIGTEMLGIRKTRRSKSLVQKIGGGGMEVKTGQERGCVVLDTSPWWGALVGRAADAKH